MGSNRQERREGREGVQARKAAKREAARKKEEVAAEKRAQKKRTATLVKQTKSKLVTRTNLKDKKPSDKMQKHSNPKSVRKTMLITDKTEKTLQEWANNVGKVGATNTVPPKKCLTTVVFGCSKSGSGTLIAYNALEGEVYGLTPHYKGYKPEEGMRYFCEEPQLKSKPLFYTNGKPIYKVMVYPLTMESVNENIELFISHDSKIAIPNWIMIEEAKKMATVLVEDGKCSAIRIKYSSLIAKAVVRKLNGAEEEKMGTVGKGNVWRLVEGVIERPPIFSALEQQEVIDLISEVIYTFKNDQRIEVQAV